MNDKIKPLALGAISIIVGLGILIAGRVQGSQTTKGFSFPIESPVAIIVGILWLAIGVWLVYRTWKA